MECVHHSVGIVQIDARNWVRDEMYSNAQLPKCLITINFQMKFWDFESLYHLLLSRDKKLEE